MLMIIPRCRFNLFVSLTIIVILIVSITGKKLEQHFVGDKYSSLILRDTAFIINERKQNFNLNIPHSKLWKSSNSHFLASRPNLKSVYEEIGARRVTQKNIQLIFGHSNDEIDDNNIYNGPILPPEKEAEIKAGIHLSELGLDIVVAPSMIAPGSLGIYVIVSPGDSFIDDGISESKDIHSITVPAFSLLSGYSKEGSFQNVDMGDKTVGFSVNGNTAVFYEKQLMSILDALSLAAQTHGNGACGLAGHILVQEENDAIEGDTDEDISTNTKISVYPDMEDMEFKRFFVPKLINDYDSDRSQDNDDGDTVEDQISIQNFGQFCNDLAWSFEDPPCTKEIYDAQSETKNIVQLIWRLEFDFESNFLIPSWPVSIISKDVTFQNNDAFMELGTKYGWNYWQGTMFLNDNNDAL